MAIVKTYNVIAIGARDNYQVALALQEKNALGRLITDFYTPDWLRGSVNKRQAAALSSRKVWSIYIVAVMMKLFPSHRTPQMTLVTNFIFGFVGGLLTHFGCGRAIVYSYYIEGFQAYYRLVSRKPKEVICFQVHPTPWYISDIIRADTASFAKVMPDFKFMGEVESVYDAASTQKYFDAVKGCNSVICASSVTRDSLTLSQSAPVESFVVPYGSKFEDRPMPARAAVNRAAGKIRLITVGQIVQRKGLHWAFTAMARLPQSLQDRYEWTVVSNKRDPGIAALAPSNVRFVSGLSDGALSQMMADHDLFVLPSLLEGFGLVYVEALSVGTPAVYTSRTGMADLGQDGVHGFEVEPSSLDALIALFEALPAKLEELEAMRSRCHALAGDFTWARFRSEIQRIIEGSRTSDVLGPASEG